MKRMGLSILLSQAILWSGLTIAPAEAAKPITVLVNNEKINVQGTIIEERTYVPLRSVGEALGLNAQWDPNKKLVTLSKPGKKIVMQIDNYVAMIDDHQAMAPMAPKIVNNSTYIPLRFLSENLNCLVKWDAKTSTVSIETFKENGLLISTQKISKALDETPGEESYPMEVTIQYPQISGLKNKEAENAINYVLKGYGEGALTQMEEIAGVSLSDVPWPSPFEPYDENEPSAFERGLTLKDINYEIVYNRNGLLNVRFTNYSYEGGAHGVYSFESFLFDINTGKQLHLRDLFKENVDYVSVLNPKIKEEFKKKDYSMLQPFESIEPNHANFNLTNDGNLVIYFTLYEYTSYAEGIPELHIPLHTLKNILKISGINE